MFLFFFFQAEDGIRDGRVTGVQTCALPISEWAGRGFLLVDTGGFLPASAVDRDARVRRQAEIAIGLSDLVLFMVDARGGLTDLDQAIARSLRRRRAPALVVVNKLDQPGDPAIHEFHALGLGEPAPVSSESGFGIGALL